MAEAAAPPAPAPKPPPVFLWTEEGAAKASEALPANFFGEEKPKAKDVVDIEAVKAAVAKLSGEVAEQLKKMCEDPAGTEKELGLVKEKKARGKPKDANAPPKPKNPYGKYTAEARPRLKETQPELASDLKAMGEALAKGWAEVPEAEKERLQKEYDKEMAIWKPKWAAYKETQEYRDFVEVKTDWLDKRAQKKLVKTMNKDAPKRPKSGYMIFAGEIRESVMVEVKEKNLGLADAGRIISERWQAISEGKKGEYGEMSQKMKIAFDKEFAEYKKGEAYGTFCDHKAKLEASQKLKKIARTHLDEAPKKAPSSYALFRNKVMPDIVAENDTKKKQEEGGPEIPPEEKKLTMGEMGKKVAELWAKVPEEEKAEYAAKAAKLKEEYDAAFQKFKTSQKYGDMIEKRAKVRSRENLLLGMRSMPKKPKSVFAMFAAEHKDEVEPGKGEGKGRDALRKKFAQASEEEKKKLEEIEKAKLEEWKKEVTDYKASQTYLTFQTTKQKIDLEFKNEATKVTTMKFLSEAPAAPPKTAFAVYLGEKRKASGDAGGAKKKSRTELQAEVKEAKDAWLKLEKVVKDGYEDKRKDVMTAYQDKVKEYMASEKWQEYTKEAKRLKIPVKSLLFHKKKIIAKLKDGKPNPASVQVPDKPETMPERPKKSLQIFMEEKKKTIDSAAERHEMWKAMSAEDKAPWEEKAKQAAEQYATELREFKTSDEGKKYLREYASAMRRRKVIVAKNKFLDDLPKKPTSALFEFMKSKLKDVKKSMPDAKGFELKKKLTEMWTALAPEEKQPLEEAAKEKFEAYTKGMADFKAGANWKKYVAMTKVKKMGKAKGKGKSKGKGKAAGPAKPNAPESMPKKPRNAMQSFMEEQGKAGKGGNLSDMAKAFAALSPEERKKYQEAASEAAQEYQKAIETWNATPEGRKFKTATANFIKKRKLADLKARFLQDEPVKPKAAYALFCDKNRAKIAAENPDVKGLAILPKLSQAFRALSDDDRKEFNDQEKTENEEYQKKLEEFHATDGYKKYKRLSTSLLMGGKMKTAAKGKAKGKAGPAIAMPPKPDNFPAAPKNGFFLFGEETRNGGGPGKLAEINKLWVNLGAEGQKKYQDQATELRNKYEEDMKQFQKSLEGKKYLRLKMQAERKMKLAKAKVRFLGGADAPKEPKRPPSAYFIYITEKGSTVQGKMGDKAKELTTMWNALSAEDKKQFEEKAKDLKLKYEEEMKTYKSSKAYKAYERTMNVVTGNRAREIARAKAKRAAMDKQKGAAGRGRGGGRGAAGGRGRGAAAAKKGGGSGSSSDGDQMGSDSKSSSSSSSESD